MYLFLMVIHVLLINKGVDTETFTLGYITGSKRRDNDLEYQRPGLRISGAITLAVEEVNNRFYRFDVLSLSLMSVA